MRSDLNARLWIVQSKIVAAWERTKKASGLVAGAVEDPAGLKESAVTALGALQDQLAKQTRKRV